MKKFTNYFRVIPGDLNNHGVALGWKVFEMIDRTAGIFVRKFTPRALTKAVNNFEFIAGVLPNYNVRVEATLLKKGNSSLIFLMEGVQEFEETEKLCFRAEIVFVAVDEKGNKISLENSSKP